MFFTVALKPQLVKCCILIVFEMLLTCFLQANPELAAIWTVGQRIWQRDFPGIYTAIAAYQWSENILHVMEALRGNQKMLRTLVDFSCLTLTCYYTFQINYASKYSLSDI